MDILNWLYLKTAGLVKTKANDPATDLVTLGAEVPFTTRGDGYQTYAMTLADAVAAGEVANNTYQTGILNLPSFPFLVNPSMVKGSTTFEQNLVTPIPFFPLGSKLESYKITGVIDLSNAAASDVLSIGTITYTGLSFGAFKVTGSVSYTDPVIGVIDQALSTNALVLDDTTSLPTDATFVFNEDIPALGTRDIYLIYDVPAAAGTISCYVTFELEVLFAEGSDVEFTF